MANYTINLDISNLLFGFETIEQQWAAKIHMCIGVMAQKTQEQWASAVMQAPGIWSPIRKAYVQSIAWHYTGPYAAEIATPLKVAEEIETGRPQRDLKRMLDSSPKVRKSKKGQRYLVIPMRHNVPGGDGHSSNAPQMPTDVYALAKQLTPSMITGTDVRQSGTGSLNIKTRKRLTVSRQHYQWGGALLSGLAPKLKAHHTTDPYAGMKKMQTGTGKATSSAYLTFRIMGEWQAGKWIVPAKPGLFIVRNLASQVKRKAAEILAFV